MLRKCVKKFECSRTGGGKAQVHAFLTMSPGILMQIIHEDSGLQSVLSNLSASVSLGNQLEMQILRP